MLVCARKAERKLPKNGRFVGIVKEFSLKQMGSRSCINTRVCNEQQLSSTAVLRALCRAAIITTSRQQSALMSVKKGREEDICVRADPIACGL